MGGTGLATIEEGVEVSQHDDWLKVQGALEKPEWDFRTVEGIARDTRLEAGRIELLLYSHRSRVRQTLSRDRRVIYTLKSRPKKLREVFANIQTFLSH